MLSWRQLCSWAGSGVCKPGVLTDAIDAAAQKLDLFLPDTVTEEWTTALQQLGFTDVEINWSGFSSQGDGASFTGRLSFPEQLIRFLAGLSDPTAPDDSSDTLEWVARTLEHRPDLKYGRLLWFHDLAGGKITRTSHHYYHSRTVTWEWFDDYNGPERPHVERCLAQFHDTVETLTVSISNAIYVALNCDYEWSLGEEQVLDFMAGNLKRGLHTPCFQVDAHRVRFSPE